MDAKGAVTVSELVESKRKDGTAYDVNIYVECSMCHGIDHMMRVAYYWERDKNGQMGLEDVDFSFPTELYVKEPWCTVKKWPWRFFQLVGEHLRRVKLSLLVLFGRAIYLCPGTSLSLETARDLGNKMSNLSTNALQDYGEKGLL